jgi:uncharacterized membrane protein
MISRLFRWRPEEGDEAPVTVNIEAPTSNTRRISSTIIVNRPINDVWRIITDYDHLSDYVPNLVQSKVIGKPETVRGVRLFQVRSWSRIR